MVEVYLFGHAPIDGASGIGEGCRQAIGTDEHVVGVDKVFHECKENLMIAHCSDISLFVYRGDCSQRGRVGRYVVRSPIDGDSWQELGGVSFVVPDGVLVVRCPKTDKRVFRQGNEIGMVFI